jgi:hypothetical protein
LQIKEFFRLLAGALSAGPRAAAALVDVAAAISARKLARAMKR